MLEFVVRLLELWWWLPVATAVAVTLIVAWQPENWR